MSSLLQVHWHRVDNAAGDMNGNSWITLDNCIAVHEAFIYILRSCGLLQLARMYLLPHVHQPGRDLVTSFEHIWSKA